MTGKSMKSLEQSAGIIEMWWAFPAMEDIGDIPKSLVFHRVSMKMAYRILLLFELYIIVYHCISYF
jgi:hypothetical protein